MASTTIRTSPPSMIRISKSTTLQSLVSINPILVKECVIVLKEKIST